MKRMNWSQFVTSCKLSSTQVYSHVSRILKGTENLTIETIAKIERVTSFKLLTFDV